MSHAGVKVQALKSGSRCEESHSRVVPGLVPGVVAF